MNPAPFGPEVLDYPLDLIDFLIVNETEAADLTGISSPDQLLDALATTWPRAQIVLTLGASGAQYRSPQEEFHLPAPQVQALDTTGAGDTFIGYFLQGLTTGIGAHSAIARAIEAAALCVTRPGAIDSIPSSTEID